MLDYACVTFRGDQSFPPLVIYVTFLQHILGTSRSGKVPLWNSQMEKRKNAKFLQKQNSINITWLCHLKVFLSRNSYYVCSAIWTHKFLNISHSDFVTLMYSYWHVTILTHSTSSRKIYFMCEEKII